jgi:hypothetical protein
MPILYRHRRLDSRICFAEEALLGRFRSDYRQRETGRNEECRRDRDEGKNPFR